MSRKYSDETKAAVTAALLTGQSVSSVAKEYKLPKGTVSKWKHEASADTAGGVTPDVTQKEEIGSLLIDYLRASLQALRAQAELFADRTWLEKQEASQVAILHGVQTDKAVRLLEALEAENGDAAA